VPTSPHIQPVSIAAVVAALLVFAGIVQVQKAWNHDGGSTATYPSSVSPRTGEIGGWHQVHLDEDQYKRSQYTNATMLISAGVVIWVVVALQAWRARPVSPHAGPRKG
jgi:hypothetical protein